MHKKIGKLSFRIVGETALFIDIKQNFHIEKILKKMYDRNLSKKYVFEGERHNFWEIIYVERGKIEVVENDEIYILSSGDMLFHAPMEFHRVRTIEDTVPHVRNLSFVVSGALPENLSDGIFRLNNEQRQSYVNLFDYIKQEMTTAKNDNVCIGQQVALRLGAFILDICDNAETTEIVSKTASAMTYKTLVRLMNKEVLSGMSLEDFAKASFVSVSYIKLVFKKYAGISPKTYYNQLRIAEAKKLLSKGQSVLQVSEKMNFSSPNHFIRFFKRHTLVTPNAFKKSELC